MAITAIEYALFKQLRDQSVLPIGRSMLELGESNWYGDVPLEQLEADIEKYADPDQCAQLKDRLAKSSLPSSKQRSWDQAKIFWDTVLKPKTYAAIDFHGTDVALKQDLNRPLKLKDKFDMVLNLGTAEHVFDLGQVFATIHKHTKPGGFMVHGLPFTGYIDHGFYNFQPTFFWDLAKANEYKILALIYAELSPLKLVQISRREDVIAMYKKQEIKENSLLYAVFQKAETNSSLRKPMQGHYFDETVSATSKSGWTNMR